jgi:hypothetical protein
MKKFATILLAAALAAAGFGLLGQEAAPVPNTRVCWTPEGGAETCIQLDAGTITVLAFDMRAVQPPAVFPIPAQVTEAFQKHIQTEMTSAVLDGTPEIKPRYESVLELIVKHNIDSLLLPMLDRYPPPDLELLRQNAEAAKVQYDAAQRKVADQIAVTTKPAARP